MRSKRDTLPTGHAPSPVRHDGAASVDRVSGSQLPMSGESLTGARRSAPELVELSSQWLERLLHLWNDLPIADGDRAVAIAIVQALASLLPGYAVGMCLVSEGGGEHEILRATSDESHAEPIEPTRLFPHLANERAIDVEPGGSTLHLAPDMPAPALEHAAALGLAMRAAQICGRAIGLARVQAHAVDAVAELQSLHAHMVQAEKLASLGQIAAGVVHELNNPLTSIVAYTDWLTNRTRARNGDADELERLGRIGESAGRMLRFTRDLVSYARPSSESPVDVSLTMVIEQAIAFCEHVIAGATVTVERQLAPDLPFVRGKPEQLAQIFVNLVTNACHAMAHSGGVLTVTTGVEGDSVSVTLRDTGHGIRPEHLRHVYTPFFTTKTSGAGTGLGLAIVKSIVDGHGGKIDVASVAGHGAAFTLTLPISRG